MRRLFILLLIALLVGVGIVAVIETDPGYVLIAYGNYTLETSLWVGLVVLLIFTLLLYTTIRVLRRVLGSHHSLNSWLGSRRSRASARLTTRGLISFIEGNWSRARRQLLRGAHGSDGPLLNYLVAARASYRLGEHDKMREYLGEAEATESEAGIAVELTQAELKLHSGKYEQALATLVRARRNAGRHPYVLDLLRRAYYGLKDWDELIKLLPELSKYQVMSSEALAELEREAYVERLTAVKQAGDEGAEHLHQVWKAMPIHLKQDREVLYQYVTLLIANEQREAAEKVIIRGLKQDWDSRLVRQYGLLNSADNSKQLAQAEKWLPAHPKDAQLLLTLGRLSAKEKLWGKARDYFEDCYRLGHSVEICAELARLLLALGEPKVAAAYYREGMESEENGLPELPMPTASLAVTKRLN